MHNDISFLPIWRRIAWENVLQAVLRGLFYASGLLMASMVWVMIFEAFFQGVAP
jgi:hypothetical protein